MADDKVTDNEQAPQTNLEKERQYQRQYRLSHLDKAAAYMRAYRSKNKEKFKKIERERSRKRKQYQQEWQARNTERRRASLAASAARYIGRKLAAEGTITAEEWLNVVKEHGQNCHYCGKAIWDFKDVSLDHVIPLSKGGRNDKSNVTPACWPCNHRKHARPAEEFMQERKPRVEQP